MEGDLTAVYLAAGLSSRFGGTVKALIKIGPNNESLMELSMNEAIEAGFNSFIIIVSPKTLEPLKNYFKEDFKGHPVKYAIQETPEYRKKPFGTTHALLSAKDVVNSPFIVLNSDDLYGINTLKLVADYLQTNDECYCLPGYRLKNTLPDKGGVNRGIIHEKEEIIERIDEKFNISKQEIPEKYNGEELVSMNLFGLQPKFLEYIKGDFAMFLDRCKDDPSTECLLPDSITRFTKAHNIKMAVIPTEDVPIGVTNPEDEEIVRNLLSD
jgi:NDP-sugar pyrophosphorylase family protein|tara:strand:- start:685 stop:1488 length:804 start_codon:yes stop_codon:yes gene_type:complete